MLFNKKFLIPFLNDLTEENNILFFQKKKILTPFVGVLVTVTNQYLIISSNNSELLVLQEKKLNYKFLNLFQDFKIKLILTGIGYKYFFNDNKLYFKLNKSHLIYFQIPEKINIYQLNTTILLLKSKNLQNLMRFIQQIKSTIKPNVFKKKGIFFINETFTLKKKNNAN